MEIVFKVAELARLKKIFLYHESFDEWLIINKRNFLDFEGDIEEKELQVHFPLRNEVWKLIYKELYGKMPFSKEYILKNYRHLYKGVPYLLYHANNPKKLIILFTGYIDYESYNRFSWYFDEYEKWDTDTAYLFLNDQSLHWYVGTPSNPTKNIYCEIIEKVREKLGIENDSIYTIGASMGGYAALLFGTICKVGGIISVHPQLCAKSADRYEKDNWKRKIYECGYEFIDINDLIAKSSHIPPIYLEISNHPADYYGVDQFLSELIKKECVFIINKNNKLEHSTTAPSKNRIIELVRFFREIRHDN